MASLGHNELTIFTSKKTSKLHVTGLCEGNPLTTILDSPHRGLVTWKMFPFDDFIMTRPNHATDHMHMHHDDVIKWKHFPPYWPFVQEIHQSQVNFPHKGQWRRSSMFSLICAWINSWVNNGEAGDLRCHRAHYDVTVMMRHMMIS